MKEDGCLEGGNNNTIIKEDKVEAIQSKPASAAEAHQEAH
jgi:hypothetical protein